MLLAKGVWKHVVRDGAGRSIGIGFGKIENLESFPSASKTLILKTISTHVTYS